MDKLKLLQARKKQLLDAGKVIREEINNLTDKDSFVELSAFSFSESEFYGDRAEGEGVVVRDKPLVESMHMVGDFSDNQPTDDNKMSQIDDYVYSYRADNLVVGTDYRFRFESPSGSYIDSWNGNFESEPAQLGVDKEAKVYPNQYKHSSIHFEIPINNASVLISLNLTDYDYITKENATYRIDLIGDIDSDGNMSIKDATRLQKALTDIITLTDVQNSVTDVNNDGVVNVSDVTAIQKMIVG